MFTAKNQVRIHDMDMAGLLYFPRQFRFVHDALEDFMTQEELSFEKMFYQHDFMFVIVHCEADYLAPMKLGDRLEIHLHCKEIGTTSFTLEYHLYRENREKVGLAKTVHVAINKKEHKKIPIPDPLLNILKKHYTPQG